MNAVRQVLKVENHRVTVQLPADFAAEEVEVIVLPAAVETSKTTETSLPSDPPLTKLQRLLLEDKTVMSDEEYELIMKKRRALH
jgi:hypothetical protein